MTADTPRLHLIYARAANGVIGKNNTLPWHLPEDLAHFKLITLGCPVIMGRKTWDSLPSKFRPLPGRLNIVVSRDPTWQAAGAVHAASLDAARALCPPGSDAWVIGGAQIYAQALPLACSVVVTEIDQAFEGDAFAPTLDAAWHEQAREKHVAANGLPFAFVTYARRD
ncbi:MAG: dihydrofolate reductase [Hydrogenophaga sp.]|uniref:dihydrofolate reductase n=1 Tax=Hydrogenophaga sp. TaxID=1904254 RepID=UPI00271C05BD|nr:dihydrofolate reductase [Hydrogenophaga sp.]MDO9148902.1 dihydrofolate reductase [Hydrogenophaga sp.]MDO9605711.1 dihydrofolate reductase [Hydrogenophaga sp.]MDP2163354.1 dihydrofolate reductase [Hydrogenophaga sp.]